MRCPFCGNLESKVNDTRASEDGSKIRRRRECLSCGKRFTSYETIETIPIVVIKKDGSRETFDKNKLLNRILRACYKRPVALNQLEKCVEEIEISLQNTMKNEVSSREIGELVMEKLKDLDEVAYIRFASVYRQFKDINKFVEEISKLIDNKK